MAIASCGVDQSGLGSMPFLPHDASSGDSAGAAGNPGAAGSSSPGTAGSGGTGGGAGTIILGTAGNSVGAAGAGTAGAVGSAGNSGAAGNTNMGDAGTSGAAGTPGTAGNAGTAGDGGNVGTAGNAGTAGNLGTAGDGGNIGTAGAAGTAGGAGTAGNIGTAGIGGVGGIAGTAGSGGRGGNGGNGFAGRGGTGGTPVPCNSFTCSDGCCKDSTTCVRMRSSLQCGSNGAACAPCGGCQTCSATGQCRVDPMSRWTITAVSAQLQTNNNWDRTTGDLGGARPDPFCEFENPSGQVSTTTAGVTDTQVDTYNATWNQVITPAGQTVAASTLMANNPAWQIWVGDDDGCKPAGCFADVACTIRQPITDAQLRAGELVVNNIGNCSSVTIDFMCQP